MMTSGDLVLYRGRWDVLEEGEVRSTCGVHPVKVVPQNVNGGIEVNENESHSVADEVEGRETSKRRVDFGLEGEMGSARKGVLDVARCDHALVEEVVVAQDFCSDDRCSPDPDLCSNLCRGHDLEVAAVEALLVSSSFLRLSPDAFGPPLVSSTCPSLSSQLPIFLFGLASEHDPLLSVGLVPPSQQVGEPCFLPASLCRKPHPPHNLSSFAEPSPSYPILPSLLRRYHACQKA